MPMIRAINLLHKTGDDLERRAKNIRNRAKQAKLIDISVKWHFLAGEIDRLNESAEKVEQA
jgi:hypothetical protein